MNLLTASLDTALLPGKEIREVDDRWMLGRDSCRSHNFSVHIANEVKTEDEYYVLKSDSDKTSRYFTQEYLGTPETSRDTDRGFIFVSIYRYTKSSFLRIVRWCWPGTVRAIANLATPIRTFLFFQIGSLDCQGKTRAVRARTLTRQPCLIDQKKRSRSRPKKTPLMSAVRREREVACEVTWCCFTVRHVLCSLVVF